MRIQGSYLVKLFILFVIYLITARFGLSLNAVSGFATLVWLPSGISLAALLIFGIGVSRAWLNLLEQLGRMNNNSTENVEKNLMNTNFRE